MLALGCVIVDAGHSRALNRDDRCALRIRKRRQGSLDDVLSCGAPCPISAAGDGNLVAPAQFAQADIGDAELTRQSIDGFGPDAGVQLVAG
jgi:hypothetical protein